MELKPPGGGGQDHQLQEELYPPPWWGMLKAHVKSRKTGWDGDSVSQILDLSSVFRTYIQKAGYGGPHLESQCYGSKTEGSWISLDSQSSLLGEFQARGSPCLGQISRPREMAQWVTCLLIQAYVHEYRSLVLADHPANLKC